MIKKQNKIPISFEIHFDNNLHYKDEDPFYINEGPYRELESHGKTITGKIVYDDGSKEEYYHHE